MRGFDWYSRGLIPLSFVSGVTLFGTMALVTLAWAYGEFESPLICFDQRGYVLNCNPETGRMHDHRSGILLLPLKRDQFATHGPTE